MSLELIKEKIILDKKLGREKTQVLLEGDIIVPDLKPDLKSILKADSKVRINSFEIVDEKVSFEGELYLQILYLTNEEDNPIHSLESTFEMSDTIFIDNLEEDCNIVLDSFVSHLEYQLVNDRKINIKSLIDVEAKVYESEEKELLIDLEGDEIHFVKNPITLSRTIANKDSTFLVKDELKIAQSSANIREILDSQTRINTHEIKVLDGQISIKGSLSVNILYISDADDNLVEQVEHEIDFSAMIDAKDAKEEMLVDCKLSLDDSYLQIRTDEDKEDRLIEIEFIILCKNILIEKREVEVIADAYSIKQELKLIEETVSYPKLVSRNLGQFTVKETIDLDNKDLAILQAYQVSANALIEKTSVLDDKIFIEGFIPTDILYLANDDDSPFRAFKKDVSFQHIIDAKNAKEDMDINIEIDIEHISYNILSENEIELRYILSFTVLVNKIEDLVLVNDIEVDEISTEKLDNIASMTIYVVQEDDDLWKIAKRYNTSIEDILKLNDIEDEKVSKGQKLLILKKMVD